MNPSSLQKRYSETAGKVNAELINAGRREDSLLLLPVSKTVDIDAVQALYDIGIRDFAENREPELLRKYNALPEDIRWHFIGRLQSNKIRKIVRCASVIHSVDTAAMLERIDRIAGEENKKPQVLIEVSVSGEEQKGGVSPAELPAIAQLAAQCKNVTFAGFMTMAPFDADESEQLQLFGKLAALRDEIAGKFNLELNTLSMGMSRDYPAAIKCGATIIRLGTVIFGEN
jgi:pyridoxal phosphate enzyme (YggS family)